MRASILQFPWRIKTPAGQPRISPPKRLCTAWIPVACRISATSDPVRWWARLPPAHGSARGRPARRLATAPGSSGVFAMRIMHFRVQVRRMCSQSRAVHQTPFPLRVVSGLFAATAFLVQLSAAEGPGLPLYRDPSAQVEARVQDLLGRMTLDEKLGQMTGAWIHLDDIAKSGMTQDQYFRKVIPAGVGSVAPLQRLLVDQDVRFRNEVQKYLIEGTRLGIPAMFHDEGCHGLVKPGASSFPNPIGLACSWDPTLVERIYNAVASEMRNRGAQLALAPVVDVARDPRWGRFDETMGEDPYLTSRMGAAIVRGFQGSADGTVDNQHVISTLKHFSGHGTPEGGLNKSPSVSTPRVLREVDLQPFAFIIRTAHPGAVMPSYNEIDGVPSHGSRWLLQDVLRGEFGFKGLIVSDYGGIGLLYSAHHVAASLAHAGALALKAGVQLELPDPESFPGLREDLANGLVTMADVDAAVREILTLKFRLGLFERPYADLARAIAAAERPETRALALEAARESIVLLKNDGILPLSTRTGEDDRRHRPQRGRRPPRKLLGNTEPLRDASGGDSRRCGRQGERCFTREDACWRRTTPAMRSTVGTTIWSSCRPKRTTGR